MHLSHLALAATLIFAASELGASVSRDRLPGDLIRPCLAELRDLADAAGPSDSYDFDLDDRCPRLAEWLAASPDAGAFGFVDIDAIGIEGLRDLQSFAAGFDREPAAWEKFSLDFDRVDGLLADVLVEETIDDSLWEQFLRWLEQYVKDGESANLDRFVDWLGNLDAPPWLGEVILNSSLVLIILLAVLVIGNEFRLAGVLHRIRRPRERQASAGAPAAVPKPRATSLEELRGLPPRQMAATVLEIVTAAFAERGWLSSSSSVTNGELARQIGQRKSDLAWPFTRLVTGIEKIIYGDRLPDEETRQRLIDSAGELIESARGGTSAVSGRTR
jgi:hypothetical protein